MTKVATKITSIPSTSPNTQMTLAPGGIPKSLQQRNINPLNELYFRKSVREHVREFGIMLSLVCVLTSLYLLMHGSLLSNVLSLLCTAYVLTFASSRLPKVMLPVWRSWMDIATILGSVSTYIILSTIWFSLFIPLGMLLKILGISVMNIRFKEDKISYWDERNPSKSDFALLRKQF